MRSDPLPSLNANTTQRTHTHHQTTPQILALLPADLSSYDQGVEELQLRAADLQRCLHILSGASGSGADDKPGSSK